MENIQVVLRIRPQSAQEVESHDPEIWSVTDSATVSIDQEKVNELIKYRKIGVGHKTQFTFNECFASSSSNLQIYENSVKRIALSSLNGINGTIFMYGQTGSGKTFTMIGPHNHDNSTSHTYESLPKDLSATPRSNKHAEHSLTGKAFRTFSIFDSEKGFDQPPKPLPKMFGRRPVSPGFAKEKTPSRSKEKSPIPNTRTKSLFKKESVANITIDLNLDKNQDDGPTFEKLSNHKRACTTQVLPSKKSPEKSDSSQLSYEIDNLRNLPENKEGVLSLALKDIFTEIEKKNDKKYFLRCSYLEIYTDLVYDLLKPQEKLGEVLSINEDNNKEFYIRGATEEIVSSLDEILNIIKKGEANRHYASTAMNHTSSRSHTIFRLYVQTLPAHIESLNSNYITESILNFVDLAGSEKVDIHDVIRHQRQDSSGSLSLTSLTPTSHKDRVKESQHINKSLFFLTQVISLKSQGKLDTFIPYRNSPLTKILRSSLGGNSRTAIVLCISPCFSQIEQAMSTLRFGQNAKKIENKIHANINNNANDEILKNLLKEYEKKIMNMEKEKSKDRYTSEKLITAIRKLQDQKNLLAERLLMLKKSEIYNQTFIDLSTARKDNMRWEHIHYENVGILHVLSPKQEEKETTLKYDFEGKYALISLKQMKQENSVLQNKLQQYKQKVDDFEKEKNELLEAIDKKDKLVNKKRNTIHQLKKKVANLQIENEKSKQIISLYQNNNTSGLKRLSLEKLTEVEKDLITLMDNIKYQKVLKTLSKNIKSEFSDFENIDLIENVLEKLGEKKPIVVNQKRVFSTLFDESFFDPIIINQSSTKKARVLEVMPNDPNIHLSVDCPIEPNGSLQHEEQSTFTQPSLNFDTFQTYFSSVNNKENVNMMNFEPENMDNRITKLRGSYKKIIDMIKQDNFEEVVNNQFNGLKEIDSNILDSINKGNLKFQSPQNVKQKNSKNYKSVTKNLNEELSFSNYLSVNTSIENPENSNLFKLFNSTEDKKVLISKNDPIKIEGEHARLSGNRIKFTCLNL